MRIFGTKYKQKSVPVHRDSPITKVQTGSKSLDKNQVTPGIFKTRFTLVLTLSNIIYR